MKNFALPVSLIAIVIAVIGCFLPILPNGESVFGSVGTRFPNGISADTTSPVAGELRGDDLTLDDDATIADDLTVSGGVLNVTTSNSATSTIIVGCFQFYATSTATAHKFMASTTPGAMVSQYGSCP